MNTLVRGRGGLIHGILLFCTNLTNLTNTYFRTQKDTEVSRKVSGFVRCVRILSEQWFSCTNLTNLTNVMYGTHWTDGRLFERTRKNTEVSRKVSGFVHCVRILSEQYFSCTNLTNLTNVMYGTHGKHGGLFFLYESHESHEYLFSNTERHGGFTDCEELPSFERRGRGG